MSTEEAEALVPESDRKSVRDGEVKGFVANGKVYLLDTLSDEEVIGVAAHEIGVHAFKLAKSEGDWNSIVKRMRALRNSDPNVKAAYDQAEAVGTPAEILDEEAIAYLAEQNPDHTIASRVVNIIKRALNKLGIGMSVIDAEVEAVQRAAVQAIRDFAQSEQTGDPKFSRRTPQQAKPTDRGSIGRMGETSYRKRNVADAKAMRAEGGSLADYGEREQREWLRGASPPKNGQLTIYRATPNGEPISPGDYVTNSRQYAELHIEANLGGKGTITDATVGLDELWPADGPGEFWYAPATLDSEQSAPPSEGPSTSGVKFSRRAPSRTVSDMAKKTPAKADAVNVGAWEPYDGEYIEAPGLRILVGEAADGQSVHGYVWPSSGGRYAASHEIPRRVGESTSQYVMGEKVLGRDYSSIGAAQAAVLEITQLRSPAAIGLDTKFSRRTPAQVAASQSAVASAARGTTRMDTVRKMIETAGKIVRAPYESAVDKLRRNPITKDLGDKIASYFDAERRRQGEMNTILRPVTLAAKEDDLRLFERIMAATQNGRANEARRLLAGASQATRDLLTAWTDVAKKTGAENQAAGVKVFDSDTGQWRPIGVARNFWPRVLQKRFQNAMQNPERYAKDWAKMVDVLIAAGRVKDAAEASVFLNAQFNDETSDDYFAGIEKARKEPLPEELYDYSWEQALRYKNNWAERISQIEAFGQEGPTGTDLFKETSKLTLNRKIQEHVQRVEDVIYKKRKNRTVGRIAATASTVATGLQLGNPASAIVNLIGGLTLSGQQFPVRYWAQAFWDMRKAGQAITDAFDKGVLVDDFFGLVADSQQDDVPERLSKITSGLLKYGGFSTAEHLARAQTLLTAKHWLRDSLKAWNANIKSRKSRLAVAWLQRNGFDYRNLLTENGQGKETDRFFRYAVNDTQGSYRIDQTPTFIDEPLGRFLLKYQKFSTQVVRMMVKNHLRPFLATLKGGEKVSIEENGKLVETRVQNFVPMLRYFAMATVGGLMAQGLRAALFGYGEQGPDDEELKKALADNENAKAMGLALERGFTAQIAIGAFGFIGNYGQALMAWQDRQRYKNPLDPPSLAPLDLIGDTLVKGIDQGGLTVKDVDAAIQQQWSMYRTARRLAGTTAMYTLPDTEFAKLEQAHRDRAWARKMARRYADEAGIESKKRAPDEPVFTPNTPINTEVKEALLVGDTERANQIALDHLKTFRSKKDIDNAKSSIQGSVRAFRPALVFEAQSAYQAEEFKAWAKANLTETGYARLQRIDDAYMQAAKASGIWNWREPKMEKEQASRVELGPEAAEAYARGKLD